MEWIINNWEVIVGILAVVIVAGFAVYKFAGLPTKEQVSRIKKWLLYAVTNAEKDLGNGTGELKLMAVYNLFIDKFPMAAKLVSFATFETWVKEALVEMEAMLKTNEAIATLVSGTPNNTNNWTAATITDGTISTNTATDTKAE